MSKSCPSRRRFVAPAPVAFQIADATVDHDPAEQVALLEAAVDALVASAPSGARAPRRSARTRIIEAMKRTLVRLALARTGVTR